MRMKTSSFVVILVLISGAAFAAFFQGFEMNSDGWVGATRVPSPTHGVVSKTGGFHAEDANLNGTTFTRWGGYSRTFPVGGYTTTIDVYLDISPPYMSDSEYANDTRFDWSSAIGTPQCGHRRDFVFNAGFYTDSDSTGNGPRFVISASTNATRSSAFPKNPARTPYTVRDEGWYTFEHRFRDNGAGVLVVELTLKNAAGIPLMMWTLSDPSDVIGQTVGGNRYGWFVINEFPFLAFDNSALAGFQDYCELPVSTAGAKVTAGGWIPVAGGKATFGLTAQVKGGGPAGNLTYHDHPEDKTVKSTAITAVIVNGDCAEVLGTAKVNNTTPVNFQVTTCDNGEPGADDTFHIEISDGYAAGGTLGGGNVQVH